MKILAFETSCDDTSIALFEDDKLIFMDTASQIKVHNETGGVVPEVAAREHANSIFSVLDNVLSSTSTNLNEIDFIGVTTNPGLLPSLLTGTTVAGTISSVLNIPIIPINHIEAHIFSNFLDRDKSEIKFPLACLTVSGGHNDIYLMNSMWELEKLGSSSDDAGGEAFDKAAKMMGLGYPGGPIISKLSKEYEDLGGKSTNLFPRVWLVKREFNFSFSGLKSSVKREVDKRLAEKGELTIDDKREISYEFENAVTEVLSWKLIEAAKQHSLKTIMLAGGVSANNKLKDSISKLALKKGLNFIYPTKITYCMDNAAMVGILTYYKIKYNNYTHKIGAVKM